MKLLYFDIETAPLPDIESRIERFYPFDPEKVALGNAKKPETVQAKIDEARANHVPNLIEKAQLNPVLSYVCAIGIKFSGDSEGHILGNPDARDDMQLLAEFVSIVEKQDVKLTGWNVLGFDAEYIWKRCWMNYLVPPRGFQGERGWKDIVDLMRIWCCHAYQSYAKLEDVAKILGAESPMRQHMGDCNGKDFYRLWYGSAETHKQARAYLTADVQEAANIGKVIL